MTRVKLTWIEIVLFIENWCSLAEKVKWALSSICPYLEEFCFLVFKGSAANKFCLCQSFWVFAIPRCGLLTNHNTHQAIL